MDEKAVVDRIEDGTHAVLLVGESETERVVPAEQLPHGAGLGSEQHHDGSRWVLAEPGGGTVFASYSTTADSPRYVHPAAPA